MAEREQLVPGKNFGYPDYEYLKVNRNATKTEGHINGTLEKHPAEDITFSSTRPTLPDLDVKSVLETIDANIQAILQGQDLDPSKDVEVLASRVSSSFGTFGTMDERLDYSDKKIKNLNIVSVLDFGAVGDGITDDTVAIQSCFDSLLDGDTVYFPKKTYIISSLLTIDKNNITILSNQATLKLITLDQKGIEISGLLESSVSVIGDIVKGDTEITLSDVTGLSVGDYVKLVSTENYFTIINRDYKKGEILEITDIDTDNDIITVAGNGVMLDYTALSGTITLNKISPLNNIVIDGLLFEGNGIAFNQTLLDINYCVNVSVRNCEFSFANAGIAIAGSVDVTINNNYIHDIDKPSTGYGISISSSTRDIVVSGNKFKRNRHSFTTGGYDGVCMNILVTSNVASLHQDNAVFNTHGNARFVTISNNTITDSWGGISTYSPYCIIKGNTIINSKVSPIYCVENGINIEISDNYIDGSAQGGTNFPAINVEQTATISESNDFVNIKNNTIINLTEGAGIRMYSSPLTSVINGNFLKNFYRHGIVIRDNGIGNLENLTIQGNTFYKGTINNFTIDVIMAVAVINPYGSNAMIKGNNIAYGTYGISITNAEMLLLEGNILNVNPAQDYILTNVTTLLGSEILRSPDGTLYKLSVANGGGLSTSLV